MITTGIREFFRAKLAEIVLALLISYGIASAVTGNHIVAIKISFFLFILLTWFLIKNEIPVLVNTASIEKTAFAAFILLCFIYLSGIPKIAFLPISPKYLLFLVIIVLLLIGQKKKDWRLIYRSGRPLWFYFILILFVIALKFNIHRAIGPFEGILLLFFTIVLVGSSIERAVLLTRCIALFTFFSAVWYLGNLLFYDTFLLMRQGIYGSMIDPENPKTLVALGRPTGLTFNHHIMGYHMAASVVIVALLIFVEKKRIYKVFWTLAFPLVFLATLLTAQRSLIPAAGLAFFLYFVLIDARKIVYLIMVAVLVFVIAEITVVSDVNYANVRQLQSRFESEEDIPSRLGWQVAALKVIANNPLGLTEDWAAEAESAGADFSYFSDTTSVHNSYLGIMLEYGWLSILAIIVVLRFLIRKIVIVLRYSRFMVGGGYATVIAFTLISLLFQAMFHNAGIFTNEPVSFMTMSLFIAWINVLRFQEQHTSAINYT